VPGRRPRHRSGRDRGVVKIEFCLLEIDLGSLQAGARRAFEGSQTIRLLLSGLIARFGLVERCLFLLEIGVRLMRPLDGSRAADQEIAVAFLFFGREVESCRRMGDIGLGLLDPCLLLNKRGRYAIEARARFISPSNEAVSRPSGAQPD
jgi:hypothetical protein